MALQGGVVVLTAIGVDAHPPLRDGTHLRWTLRPKRGFPPLGFDVFRRGSRNGSFWGTAGEERVSSGSATATFGVTFGGFPSLLLAEIERSGDADGYRTHLLEQLSEIRGKPAGPDRRGPR